MTDVSELVSGLAPFLAVVEERSFRRAAERLRVSPAAVSKAVARLEDQLGTRLLERTTRSLRVTPDGEVFFARSKLALASLQAAKDSIVDKRKEPHGDVRLSVPFVLGRMIMDALPGLLARAPRLRLRLDFADRLARLWDDDVDVGVRMGPLAESSLVARVLCRPRWRTIAAPAYLARHGTPTTVADLAGHACVRFVGPSGRVRDWTFVIDGAPETQIVDGPVLLDHGPSLVDAARSGVGIVQVLDFMIDDADLRAGRLVEVLADAQAPGPIIHAVTTPARARTANARAVIDFLVATLRRS